MNQLLTAVKKFNDRHRDSNVFAHFEYAGHVDMVAVRVDHTPSRYNDKDDVQQIYYEYYYLSATYGKQPTIEALTEHFAQWVKEYENE